MVGVKWAVPKNKRVLFSLKKRKTKNLRMCTALHENSKGNCQEWSCRLFFFLSQTFYFFSMTQRSGFLLTLSTSAISFILSIVCMTMATGEICRQLWQNVPCREKHLELQQLGPSQGNEVKHRVSLSAQTSGQRLWKCTCAWWRCVNTHPPPAPSLLSLTGRFTSAYLSVWL